MGSKARIIVGSVPAIGGLLMVADGICAEPHAFARGHSAAQWLVGTGLAASFVEACEVVRAKAS